MRKRILAGATLILAVGGVLIMASDSYAWVKADINKPMAKTTAYLHRIENMSVVLKSDKAALKKVIDALEQSIKDTKSPAVKKQIKNLKRLWENKRKQLDNAAQSREKVLVQMESGKTVSML